MQLTRVALGVASTLTLASGLAGCSSKDSAPAATGTGASSSTSSSSGASSSSGGAGGATSSSSSGTGGAGGSAAMPPDWSCLGSVAPFDAPAGPTATSTITYADFLSDKPMAGLVVKVCQKSDPTCASPADTQTSDSMGAVALTIPLGSKGFDGYFDVVGTSVSWLNFSAPPITADETYKSQIVTAGELNALAAIVSQTLDPARGQLIVQGRDCGGGGKPSGISYSVDTGDAKSKAVYLTHGLPDKKTTETDPSGIGAILNVPEGAATVTAKVASSGMTIGSYELLIVKGRISSVYLPPMPP